MKDINKKLEEATIIFEKYLAKKNWVAEIILDPYTNHPFIMSHITRIFATQFKGIKTYQHPNGTWQYFKQNYFPIWLRKHFPVKMKEITFSFMISPFL